jgi:DNA-binding beta-propeller fold protein YncE
VSTASAFALAVAGMVGVTATPAHAATTMNLAYVADVPSDVRVVDMATNTIVSSIPMASIPSLVVASPDKRTAYALHYDYGGYGDSLSVIDASTSSVTRTMSICHGPTAATMKPNSTELWIACYSGGISVFDTTSETVTRTIITGVGGLDGLSFTADGSTVYSTFRSTIAVPTNPVAGIVAVNTATGAATTIADTDAGSGRS